MSGRNVLLLALIGGLFFPQNFRGQPSGAWYGTWNLNRDKSADSASSSRYARVTTRIEPWEDGLRVTYDMVGTRGGVTHLEWSGRFDGKDYVVQGADYVLTNAYSRIDDQSYSITVKVDDRIVATATVTISPDGKTLTTMTKEKNSRGQDVVSTTVYDRQ